MRGFLVGLAVELLEKGAEVARRRFVAWQARREEEELLAEMTPHERARYIKAKLDRENREHFARAGKP